MRRIDPSRLRAAERIRDMSLVRIRELLGVGREAMRIRADAIALLDRDKADALREDIEAVGGTPSATYEEKYEQELIPELGDLVEFEYNGCLRVVEVAKLVAGRLEGFELWRGEDFVAHEGQGNYKAYRIDRMETVPEVVA